jgi:hypothetical protein
MAHNKDDSSFMGKSDAFESGSTSYWRTPSPRVMLV